MLHWEDEIWASGQRSTTATIIVCRSICAFIICLYSESLRDICITVCLESCHTKPSYSSAPPPRGGFKQSHSTSVLQFYILTLVGREKRKENCWIFRFCYPHQCGASPVGRLLLKIYFHSFLLVNCPKHISQRSTIVDIFSILLTFKITNFALNNSYKQPRFSHYIVCTFYWCLFLGLN